MGSEATSHLRDVVVEFDDGCGVRQPGTFQMCGLGVQFYSDRRIPEFQLLEFDLHVDSDPRSPANIHCTGAVVKCREVNEPGGKYRIWLKFLDAPETTCSHLSCIARKGKHLCSFCASRQSLGVGEHVRRILHAPTDVNGGGHGRAWVSEARLVQELPRVAVGQGADVLGLFFASPVEIGAVGAVAGSARTSKEALALTSFHPLLGQAAGNTLETGTSQEVLGLLARW